MGTEFNNPAHVVENMNKLMEASNESLETFTSIGFKMLVEATKKSNNLPSGKVRDLYESYPSFHSIIKNQGNYILSIISKMMKYTNCRGSIINKDDDDKFEMIVDSNDALLENVGITLDELSGVKKNPEAKFLANNIPSISGSWNNNKRVVNKAASQVLNKILNQTKNMEKPQLKFKEKVNNDSNTPFEPRIKYKYNMLKPLACLLETTEDGFSQFSHPYEFELEKFKPSQEQMKCKLPTLYKSLSETPLVMVTTPEDVTRLVNDLEKYNEIAVDLEHHSYRSFQGFTCLMQISTRDTDYIIDTLTLRSDLEILNKVFTNPSVVKVLHGADLDILWLQRDLALYVVNMFNTYQAAKVLGFPRLSLKYLLSYYCNVTAQKEFQLADWRVRPLPEELITYAREDTHYLLFIYDNLRNALIEKANGETNLLNSVISESTRLCLKRYIKPMFESDGYLDLYHRSKKLFDNRQKFALQKLFEWRDKTARELDESYGYVLPDHMMLNISEVLPREAQGILACCNPIPVPVRQNFLVLHHIILKAREQPLIKPVLEEQRLCRYTSASNSSNSLLQCPHDLNHDGEFRDDLPVLITKDNVTLDENRFSNNNNSVYDYSKPIIDIFQKSVETIEKVKLQSVEKKVIHLTPYHRYKLSKKFSESIEFKSTQDNTIPSIKKEPDCDLEKTLSKPIEISGKDENELKHNKKKNSRESRPNSTAENDMNNSKKRKAENEAQQTKRLKQEVSTAVQNPVKIKEEKPENEVQRKKKKKATHFKRKDKEFQPFNYNSVDFKQYKSSQNMSTSASKKAQKKGRVRKKSGKKNFKMSV